MVVFKSTFNVGPSFKCGSAGLEMEVHFKCYLDPLSSPHSSQIWGHALRKIFDPHMKSLLVVHIKVLFGCTLQICVFRWPGHYHIDTFV